MAQKNKFNVARKNLYNSLSSSFSKTSLIYLITRADTYVHLVCGKERKKKYLRNEKSYFKDDDKFCSRYMDMLELDFSKTHL